MRKPGTMLQEGQGCQPARSPLSFSHGWGKKVLSYKRAEELIRASAFFSLQKQFLLYSMYVHILPILQIPEARVQSPQGREPRRSHATDRSD